MTDFPTPDIDEQRAAAELRELERRNAAELQALHEDVKELRSLRRQLWVALALKFLVGVLFLAAVAGLVATADRPGILGQVGTGALLLLVIVSLLYPLRRFRK